MNKTSAIILAAGRSLRAGSDKQFLKLNGRYLIEVTLSKFISEVDEIVVALSKDNIEKHLDIFSNSKIKVVEGGNTRIESLINASRKLSDNSQIILVHDGARPFVSKQLINKMISASKSYGCAVPVIPLKDTVKEVDINSQKVIKTIERDRHFLVQTPQGYRRDIFERIVKSITNTSFTDDSQIAESLGMEVRAIIGEETNIKITTPLDIIIAGVIYEETQKKF
ncbi:MAG: 2-C-methyl-D-erythritol 4-phosphate cytidylyltransferase [Elusimicrobiales bacterium]